MNPFSSLFDSLHLLREVAVCRASYPLSWSGAVHHAIMQRLDETLGAARLVRDKHLKVVRTDLRVRSVVAVLCILQYAKACGFHGVPIFFFLSTVLFVSWITMEVLFCAACLHGAHIPHRILLSTTPCPKPSLLAAAWSFPPLGVVLFALLPISVSAVLASAARLIIMWHTCVLWLPLLLISWSPASLRSFPNPEDSYIKTLILLYVIMIVFLVLIVVYWCVALVTLGLIIVPLYLAGLGAVSGFMKCGRLAQGAPGVGRAVAAALVVGGGVGLWVLFVSEGTSREAWMEWML